MEPIPGTQVLRNSQKTLRGLFRQLEIIGRRAHEMKKSIASETWVMLQIHLDLEEEFIYPPLRNAKREEDRESASKGLFENHEIRKLISAVRHRDPSEENFDIGAANLITTVEEHFQTEIEQIIPSAEQVLGSLLDEIGPRMEARREEWLTGHEKKRRRMA